MEMQTRKTTSWFETWRTSMRRWLSSRTSPHPSDVDEVAQEVYLRLLNYSDDALADNPQDHLFRIAAGVTNERHECAPAGVSEDESQLADEEPAEPQVFTALSHLSQQQREALLLHAREGLTYRQIAVRMQLSSGVARQEIVSAYVNLRYELRSVKLDVMTTV